MADDLFERAMRVYDTEGRHSQGIYAVMKLVAAETRRKIEADIERYPHLQQAREARGMMRQAEADRDEAFAVIRKLGARERELELVNASLQADLARLDARRSGND